MATAAGNGDMLAKLGTQADQAGKHNVSFLSYFMLGQLEKCLQILLDSNRIPEAAFFARTYLPSEISRIVEMWREQLSKVNEKAGQRLADPKVKHNSPAHLYILNEILLNCRTIPIYSLTIMPALKLSICWQRREVK